MPDPVAFKGPFRVTSDSQLQWLSPLGWVTFVSGGGVFDTAFAAALDDLAAPLQPFPVWLQYGGRLVSVSGGYSGITLNLSSIGATYADPNAIAAWLVQAIYFIQPNLGSAPLTIDLSENALSNTEDILDEIAFVITETPFTDYGGGFTIYLQGGTNAAPTPATAHQDATLVLQLPAPISDNAGTVLSGTDGTGNVLELNYDNTTVFAASNLASDGPTTIVTIGVSDSPAMAAIVGYINTSNGGYRPAVLSDYSPSSIDSNGTLNTSDTVEGDYPLNLSGPAVVSNNPGVVAVPNASIAAIQAYNGSTVSTN